MEETQLPAGVYVQVENVQFLRKRPADTKVGVYPPGRDGASAKNSVPFSADSERTGLFPVGPKLRIKIKIIL